MKTLIAVVAGVYFLSVVQSRAVETALVVHEWGTFTSLQDENGNAIGGINTDDEPVPDFVHRIAPFLLLSPNEVLNRFSQGAPFCHPDVTMRLETPVVYFHLPKSERKIQTFDVNVRFRGGWLSEFYPDAIANASGIERDQHQLRGFRFGPLTSNTISALEWNGLQAGGDWPVTNTTEHVWTSPRAVNAALVRSTNGESEQFLFYRGVAHLNAPLSISRDTETDQLLFRSLLEMPTDKPLTIPKIWLVDIRDDGKMAFRPLPSLTVRSGASRFLTRTAASFERKDFASGNLNKLRVALREALVADGLFQDEAQALLNTWELSYFKSPGLRVFFLVPREWTDFYLPLAISAPSKVNRVMVGRIELITPEQQKILTEIGHYSNEEITAAAGSLGTNFMNALQKDPKAWEKMTVGATPMSDYMPVPAKFQSYLNLGRFRQALVLNQEQQHSTPGLTNFIARFGLHAYRPVY